MKIELLKIEDAKAFFKRKAEMARVCGVGRATVNYWEKSGIPVKNQVILMAEMDRRIKEAKKAEKRPALQESINKPAFGKRVISELKKVNSKSSKEVE